MKLEHGKTYRNSNGEKIGPLEKYGSQERFRERPYDGRYWREDGTANHDAQYDLIAEWTDGPVVTETVTKTRIVPGVFSHVVVEAHHGPSMVGVGFEAPGEMQFIRCMSADQLDAAAAVLSALAKGLRDA